MVNFMYLNDHGKWSWIDNLSTSGKTQYSSVHISQEQAQKLILSAEAKCIIVLDEACSWNITIIVGLWVSVTFTNPIVWIFTDYLHTAELSFIKKLRSQWLFRIGI